MANMKLLKKYYWIFLVVLFLAGVGIFLKIAYTPTPGSENVTLTAVSANDQVKGATESAHVLVEYSDFQCPACAAYQPLVKKLLEDKGSEFLLVYRHFPLMTIHKHAELAARVAEAAGKQEKFWEMHDRLFATQTEWSKETNAQEFFLNLAKELGLNLDQFKNDLESEEVKSKVRNDIASGQAARVQGTPTFFVNGRQLSNPRSYDDLEKQVFAPVK